MQISIEGAKKPTDATGELARMLREAAVAGAHCDIFVKIKCDFGKPVIVTTGVEVRVKQ